MIRLLLASCLVLLLVGHVEAGGCRNQLLVQSPFVAVQQADYYYAVNPQQKAPFTYSGDVDAILNNAREAARLQAGLNQLSVQTLQGLNQNSQQLQVLPLAQSPVQRDTAPVQPPCIPATGPCPPGMIPNPAYIPGPISPPVGTTPPPVVPAGPASAADQLNAQAVVVMTRGKCLACHGKASPDGGFAIAVQNQVLDLPRGDRFEIHGKAATNEMPPKGSGSPLTPEDLDILYRWANAKSR